MLNTSIYLYFSVNISLSFLFLCCYLCICIYREIQAQEALQNGQLGSGEGIPDLQPGVLASQAMIEKTLTEDPRWQGGQLQNKCFLTLWNRLWASFDISVIKLHLK